jgi:hypothetical protein
MGNLPRQVSQSSWLSSVRWDCVHYFDSFDQAHTRIPGAFVASIEGEKIGSKLDMLDALAMTFQFPGYFGRNLDALDECLRDLNWLPADRYGCVIWNSNILLSQAPKVALQLINQWLACAQVWAERGVPFHLAFAFNCPDSDQSS